MTIASQVSWVSVEDYLKTEKYSLVKHEYVDGHVYAMTGASKAHSLIVANLAAMLRPHLRGGPCRVYLSDVKVCTGTRFYYPDLVVSCERSSDPYVETQPRLIIEVLSESTVRIDREEKRLAYQTLPSLQEYALAAQATQDIQIYRRIAGEWMVEEYGPGGHLALTSIDLEIAVETVYEDVDVSP